MSRRYPIVYRRALMCDYAAKAHRIPASTSIVVSLSPSSHHRQGPVVRCKHRSSDEHCDTHRELSSSCCKHMRFLLPLHKRNHVMSYLSHQGRNASAESKGKHETAPHLPLILFYFQFVAEAHQEHNSKMSPPLKTKRPRGKQPCRNHKRSAAQPTTCAKQAAVSPAQTKPWNRRTIAVIVAAVLASLAELQFAGPGDVRVQWCSYLIFYCQAAAVVGTILGWLGLTVYLRVRNLFSNIPGPYLAKTTLLWKAFYIHRKAFNTKLISLHNVSALCEAFRTSTDFTPGIRYTCPNITLRV